MKKTQISPGKFLSLVLRHKPEAVGMALDPQGWADVESLLAGCRKKGLGIDRKKLLRIVEDDDKRQAPVSAQPGWA